MVDIEDRQLRTRISQGCERGCDLARVIGRCEPQSNVSTMSHAFPSDRMTSPIARCSSQRTGRAGYIRRPRCRKDGPSIRRPRVTPTTITRPPNSPPTPDPRLNLRIRRKMKSHYSQRRQVRTLSCKQRYECRKISLATTRNMHSRATSPEGKVISSAREEVMAETGRRGRQPFQTARRGYL